MKKWILTFLFVLSHSVCWAALVDGSATTETVALYNTLSGAGKGGTGIIIGQSFDGESNDDPGPLSIMDGEITKIIPSKYPNIMTFWYDMAVLDNLQPNMVADIKRHYRNGGIIAINWGEMNYCTGVRRQGNGIGGTDMSVNCAPQVVIAGAPRTAYLAELDDFATWVNANMRDDSGNLIPFLFKPYPETDITGRWWCVGTASDAEFTAMWQDTFSYLTTTKGLHNIIWVYTITDPAFNTGRYPGNSYVDVIGEDCYAINPSGTFDDCTTGHQPVQSARDLASNNSKIWGIAESLYDYRAGQGRTPSSSDWTTNTFSKILNDSTGYGMKFFAVYTSCNWGPCSGRADASDWAAAMQLNGIAPLLDYGDQLSNVTLKNYTKQ